MGGEWALQILENLEEDTLIDLKGGLGHLWSFACHLFESEASIQQCGNRFDKNSISVLPFVPKSKLC